VFKKDILNLLKSFTTYKNIGDSSMVYYNVGEKYAIDFYVCPYAKEKSHAVG
jgi:hypothetical protein